MKNSGYGTVVDLGKRKDPRPERTETMLPNDGRPPKRGGMGVLRWSIITIGALLLTTLAIKASDALPGSGATNLASVAARDARCPVGMSFVSSPAGNFCIDTYESSPGKGCPKASPRNLFDSMENVRDQGCVPVSESGGTPWTNVPLSLAQSLCARVGKHLSSPEEWYRAALGTPDSGEGACALGFGERSMPFQTGAFPSCVSGAGAQDMIGNVWEWVDATIVDGTYGERELPGEGYVVHADSEGLPVATAPGGAEIYAHDYFSVELSGVRGMFRGGFWGMTEKAGLWSANATQPHAFVGNAVGFRCAQ